MLNSSKPPFDNVTARQAMAYATDVDTYITTFQIDPENKTNSAFGKDSPYYADNPFPTYDPDKARELVQQYTNETGQPLQFTLGTTPVPINQQVTQLLQQQYQAVGMQVQLVVDRAGPVHRRRRPGELSGEPVAPVRGDRPRRRLRVVAQGQRHRRAGPQHRAVSERRAQRGPRRGAGHG